MNPSLRNQRLESPPESVVTVLAISSNTEDLSALHQILDHSNWVLREAKDCHEAVDLLKNRSAGVILCEHDLSDGTWRDVQSAASAMPTPPPVVVSSLQADDRMWAEVLNLGGYDVLAKPYESNEVIRIISLAWRHWKDSTRGKRPMSESPVALAAAS